MKLLACKKCSDVFSLRVGVKKYCSCGLTWGEYLDYGNATYSGEGIPLGFANDSFINAIRDQPKTGEGKDFIAFVIPSENNSFKREEVKHDHCKVCGDDFTSKDIDGGRCLSCGTMIAAECPECGPDCIMD